MTIWGGAIPGGGGSVAIGGAVTGATAGSLLVGNPAGTLAQIAAVAVNQVLTSAGTGTVPVWSGSPTLEALTLSQVAASSGAPTLLTVTGAAHTALTASTEVVDIDLNLARTVQFATGAKTTQRAALIQAPTYSAVGVTVITNAATLAISGAPAAGTNVTITNPYSLWVQGGTARFDGGVHSPGSAGVTTLQLGNSANASNSSTTAVGSSANSQGAFSASFGASASCGSGAIAGLALGASATSSHSRSYVIGTGGNSTAANQFVVFFNDTVVSSMWLGNGQTAASPTNTSINASGGSGSNVAGASISWNAGAGTGNAAGGSHTWKSTLAGASASTLRTLYTQATLDNLGNWTLTPGVATTGSPTHWTLTGAAHTTLTASTEAPDVNVNLARTVQWETGALATQRFVRYQAPTIAFAGASVVSDTATVAISGAPIAGTNATLTRSYALWIESGMLRLGGAFAINRTATAVTTNAALTDHYIGVTDTSSARTINLPPIATAVIGQEFEIADESGVCNINNITVQANGVELIDGANTFVLSVGFQVLKIRSTGTFWKVV